MTKMSFMTSILLFSPSIIKQVFVCGLWEEQSHLLLPFLPSFSSYYITKSIHLSVYLSSRTFLKNHSSCREMILVLLVTFYSHISLSCPFLKRRRMEKRREKGEGHTLIKQTMCSVFLFFHVNYLRVVKYFEMSLQVGAEEERINEGKEEEETASPSRKDDDSHLHSHPQIPFQCRGKETIWMPRKSWFSIFFTVWGLDWQWIYISGSPFLYFMTFSFQPLYLSLHFSSLFPRETRSHGSSIFFWSLLFHSRSSLSV